MIEIFLEIPLELKVIILSGINNMLIELFKEEEIKLEKARIKKKLKRELSSRRKYKTTYKDIKYYFNMINKAVFKNKLAPFNDIKIKKIYKDKSKKFCYGQVTTWVWERKGTQQFWLEMLPEYRSKKDFVDTLGHEMVHLYQMAMLVILVITTNYFIVLGLN